jgi:hypothetical protein
VNGNTIYPEIMPSEAQESGANLVFLSSEPFPFKEKQAAEIRTSMPDANIVFVDGAYFSWYGSRLAHAPAYFIALLESIRYRN